MTTTSQSNNNNSGQQPFWTHVDALRQILVRAAAVVMALTVVMFVLMPQVFDRMILAPCHSDFPLYRLFAAIASRQQWFPQFVVGDFNINIVNIRLASQFMTHVSLAFWSALLLSIPVLLWLVWSFVAPALYAAERKRLRWAFAFGAIMFYVGVVVAYFIVFPLTLRFLADYQISAQVVNQLSLDSYIDNFLMLMLSIGLAFELPLLAWVLGSIGITSRHTFITYRRHAIVGLLVAAALITPTGDPFTLTIVFLPLYLLWELSARLQPNQSHPTIKID